MSILFYDLQYHVNVIAWLVVIIQRHKWWWCHHDLGIVENILVCVCIISCVWFLMHKCCCMSHDIRWQILMKYFVCLSRPTSSAVLSCFVSSYSIVYLKMPSHSVYSYFSWYLMNINRLSITHTKAMRIWRLERLWKASMTILMIWLIFVLLGRRCGTTVNCNFFFHPDIQYSPTTIFLLWVSDVDEYFKFVFNILSKLLVFRCHVTQW